MLTAPPATGDDSIASPTPAPAAPGNLTLAGLGLSVSEKPTDGGVSVTAAGGPAAKSGIVAGDLIEQVAGEDVASAADLQTQVKLLATSHVPVAVLLVSGDAANGSDPGPRWVPVPFKK
jgi:S1-C subfamily serine protease